MRFNWLPWRYLMSRAARSHGFLDPIPWLNRLRGFAHPSEVTEPVELLRAGVLFHARGLINTKAIQHNLDWVWPYWAERQFNPADKAFLPRAFSFSHVNLTHRNWTAVGLPDVPFYPIVDPRGLVTPFHDSWSLDFWLYENGRPRLLPSKLDHADQELEVGDNLVVRSRFEDGDCRLETEVSMEMRDQAPCCVVRARASAPPGCSLLAVVRPYNPEGVSFIDGIRADEDRRRWRVEGNGDAWIEFNLTPEKTHFSNYRKGDVALAIEDDEESTGIECAASMAAGAAAFPLSSLGDQTLEVRIPVLDEMTRKPAKLERAPGSWTEEINGCARMDVPDPLWSRLYDEAVATLILHAPAEVYPGPYTYKRFWYRDAAFILNALLTVGGRERTRRALDLFPRGQTLQGYFRSQAGEWDSNGEVLWIIRRYLQLTGDALPEAWKSPVEKGARWIVNKRLSKDLDEPHAGLLPAGFSAEHLGPNDFYYWDDFWGVAGLDAAAGMLRKLEPKAADGFARESLDFMETIKASFRHLPTRRFKGAISASPHRRMDAGAVGSLVADYPLRLFPPGDDGMMRTVDYLLEHSSFDGGFFQNMIHSGINAYLTLHLAQVLLRAGDPRALDLVDTVARLAGPTGQWPEAIHPQTGGGCMGDGQHVWAAAEWVMMMRNLFVQEEGDRLVLGAGIPAGWLATRKPLSYGPTLTPFGAVTVRLEPAEPTGYRLTLDARWRGDAPKIDVRVPGHANVVPGETSNEFLIKTDL